MLKKRIYIDIGWGLTLAHTTPPIFLKNLEELLNKLLLVLKYPQYPSHTFASARQCMPESARRS